MVIIAGYEEDLKKCFFAYNQGLDSRFPWRFKTDDYDAHDLNLIFQKKIKDAGWSLEADLEDKWFKDNMDYFKYYGRFGLSFKFVRSNKQVYKKTRFKR